MLNVKIMLAVFLLIPLIMPAALASEVEVTKTAPSSIIFGDSMDVTITVANNMDAAITAEVIETVGNAQPVSQELVVPQGSGIIAPMPPYLEWNLEIAANSRKNVTYTIKPNKAGYYIFSPTTVTAAGNVFYSTSLSTLVECNSNGVCEDKLGEDATTCKADCVLTGRGNDYCDGVKDGMCDPDCYPEQDADCPTGSADGYCDSVSDGRCDPDCGAVGVDADCATAEKSGSSAGFSANMRMFVILGGVILTVAAAVVLFARLRNRGEADSV